MPSSEDKHVLSFRPCLSTYLLLDGIPAVLLAAYVMGCLAGFHDWNAVVLLGVVLACVHIWIWRHRIIISDAELRYEAPFSRRRIEFSEVKDFRFAVGLQSYWDRFKCQGFVRLIIRPRRARVDPVVINVKLFGRNDVGTLVKILTERVGESRRE